MNCTACKKGTLVPSYLDDSLACYECNHCHGNWLYLHNYLRWLNKQDGLEAEKEFVITKDDFFDSKHILLCPKTGNLMLKYRISARTDHRIDLSPEVNGIWLDKGEWELLKSENLEFHLNAIFTEPWQKKVRRDEAKDVFKALYTEEFGQEAYTKIQQAREWIYQHPEKQKLLAYLLANNPYAVGD